MCREALREVNAQQDFHQAERGMTPLMSALFSLLAAVASLLAMMWVVVQVHKSRNKPAAPSLPESELDPEDPWWRPKQPFTALRLPDAFDPERCVVWESQTEALTFICEGAGRGVPTPELALMHRILAARNPELYDGSGFGEWVRFLEDCDLVRRRADRVFITAAGEAFVASCLRRKRPRKREAKAA